MRAEGVNEHQKMTQNMGGMKMKWLQIQQFL